MMITQFAPTGPTLALAATTVAQSAQLPTAPDGSGSGHVGGPGDYTLRYAVDGTGPVFIGFGLTAAIAIAAAIAVAAGLASSGCGMIMPSGLIEVQRVPDGALFIGYVCRTAQTPVLYVTPGIGA